MATLPLPLTDDQLAAANQMLASYVPQGALPQAPAYTPPPAPAPKPDDAAPQADALPPAQPAAQPVLNIAPPSTVKSAPAIPFAHLGISPDTQTLLDKYGHVANTKSGLDNLGDKASHVDNPILRGLAKFGVGGLKVLQGVGDAFAPELTTFLPGTDLNHQLNVDRARNAAAQGLSDDTEAAKAVNEQATANKTTLDPILSEDRIAAMQQHYQDQLDQKDHALQSQMAMKDHTLNLAMAQHGLRPKADANGQTVRDANGNVQYEVDPDSPITKQNQARADYFQARQQLATDQAALARSKNDPDSPAFRQAQQKVAAEMARVGVMEQQLGLSTQKLGFEQDKFYNPQPTATERRTGDLAQSALERINEMRAIVAKRPDLFGPGAGRGTHYAEWIGSQDPDAQTFLSAAQYLTDHSAGVFGGRGKYITEQLGRLTDPKMNPAALGASLDEAQRAAQGFATAGQVHHAPASHTAATAQSGFSVTAPNGRTYTFASQDALGHFKKLSGVK